LRKLVGSLLSQSNRPACFDRPFKAIGRNRTKPTDGTARSDDGTGFPRRNRAENPGNRFHEFRFRFPPRRRGTKAAPRPRDLANGVPKQPKQAAHLLSKANPIPAFPKQIPFLLSQSKSHFCFPKAERPACSLKGSKRATGS